MNNTELDTENINTIDISMDSRYIDDEDDSFGSIKDTSSDSVESTDDRNFQPKTGIIIDLSDDESDARPMRTLKANLNQSENKLDIEANFDSQNIPAQGYNEIDMDTDYFDDEDEDLIKKDGDIEVTFEKSETEIDLSESKKYSGEVDKNYWKELTKKHLKSNKKGAYNTHFHLAGNPEAERRFFNQSMGLGSETDNTAIDGISSNSIATNITGVASSSGDSGGDAAGGFGESLETSANEIDSKSASAKLLRELLDIIGADVIRNSDNSFTLIDLTNPEADYTCKDINELKFSLQPYMEDCFIYPLQITTGEKFNTCDEWCNWYAVPENQKANPKCAADIKYCDLFASMFTEDLIEELL